jgi:hypothetical protein
MKNPCVFNKRVVGRTTAYSSTLKTQHDFYKDLFDTLEEAPNIRVSGMVDLLFFSAVVVSTDGDYLLCGCKTRL